MSKNPLVIVPCFNEEERLPNFLNKEKLNCVDFDLLFVDDCSTDRTQDLLAEFCQHNDRIAFMSLPKNVGKGEAVRTGILEAIKDSRPLFGFMDADLATPLNEMQRILTLLENSDFQVAMGSRVKRLGSQIDRKTSRHILGRVFATIASLALDIGVYDTQCGAKIFRNSNEIQNAFSQPFTTRWAFDIELIGRLLYPTSNGTSPMTASEFLEVPLTTWRDIDGSKVTFKEVLRLGTELLRLSMRISKDRKQSNA